MSTEVQVQTKNANEKSQRKSDEFDESDIDNSIKTLQEESHQMIELLEIEKTYSGESIAQFKRIIEPLGVSYNIKEAWSGGRTDIDKSVLTSQGIVCIMYSSGIVQTKPLESISNETLLKILGLTIPEVKHVLSEKRQITALRASLLERVARELGKVSDDSEEHKPKAQAH